MPESLTMTALLKHLNYNEVPQRGILFPTLFNLLLLPNHNIKVLSWVNDLTITSQHPDTIIIAINRQHYIT